MKKIVLGSVAIIALLIAMFYSQLRATIDFYTYQKDNASAFKSATLTWDTLPFTSDSRAGLATDALVFQNFTIPVPYGATKSVGKDAAFATGYVELITIAHSSAAANFFHMYNFSESDEEVACALLARSSGRGACTTNYDFYRAFLELNTTDMHVFSSIKEKEMYNRLVPLRADIIPSQTVAGFETSAFRGFLYTIDAKNFVAEIFTAADEQYHLEFAGLQEADVAFVLSNTVVQR